MFEKDTFYKNLLAQEIGKHLLNNIEELDFKEIAENTAVKVLAEIQKIILDDKASEGEKVLYIEDILLNYGFNISGKYD